MVAASIAISVFAWKRRPIGRVAGILFLAGYAAYLAVLVVRTVAKVG
jgi:Ca2+/Na+ antiporter